MFFPLYKLPLREGREGEGERERGFLIPYSSIGVKRIHFLTHWTRDPCSLKLVTIHTKVERSLGGQWRDPEREEEGTCYCLFRSYILYPTKAESVSVQLLQAFFGHELVVAGARGATGLNHVRLSFLTSKQPAIGTFRGSS